MDVHGFLRSMQARIVDQEEDSCTLEFRDSAESRKIYPFSFRLQQSYRVKDNRLDVCSRVENLGIEVMYFALGGHPGFYLPFSKKQALSDYAIHFPKQEAMMEKVRFSKDLLTLEERENFALVNGRLPLETVLFRNDAVEENWCWEVMTSRSPFVSFMRTIPILLSGSPMERKPPSFA